MLDALYAVWDLDCDDPASVDTYHYKVQFRPEELLPDVDVQVGGGDN